MGKNMWENGKMVFLMEMDILNIKTSILLKENGLLAKK